jgi:hypothetical protein
MQDADVVIDQLLIGWYGMVAVEAWSFIKPVICYISPYLYKKYDVPVHLASPLTIKVSIRDFVDHPEKCEIYGVRGREYVERVHDIRKLD